MRVIKLGEPGTEKHYTGLTPQQAVIAAHAQDNGDWNTWDYADKYGHMVMTGKHSVSCGDWATLLQP